MMKKKIDSPFRKLKLLMVLPFIVMVFYAFAKPEYISSTPLASANKITTIAEALNELKVPLDFPVDKTEKVTRTENRQIAKGKVVNPAGKPIEGTSVSIKGTTTGTITDKNGNFRVKDVPAVGELIFSFAGYQTVEVKPDFNQPMLIKMEPETKSKNQVVVVGYGITPPPFGSPTNFKNIENSPLYVVDGTPVPEAIFHAINPETIKSVQIFKDQSAIDKYGYKAKNGLVEVTLKPNIKSLVLSDSLSHQKFSVRSNAFISDNSSKENPLFVLDGVIIDKAKMDAINPEDIESLNVLKNKDAIEKYGEKAKNGVIEIATKVSNPYKYNNKRSDFGLIDKNTNDTIRLSANGNVIFNSERKGSPCLYILDGIVTDISEINKLDPESIKFVTYLKDEDAIEKFGEKGKNGVILISSKPKTSTANDKKVE